MPSTAVRSGGSSADAEAAARFYAETFPDSSVGAVQRAPGDFPSGKEGDPLTKDEVALIERWIKEGAKDDTPPEANSFKLSAPPVYSALPVISAIAFSPDGKILAVSGYHEVVLHICL